MAKTRESCFAIAILAIAHFCNSCEAVLSAKEQDKVSKLPGQNFNVNFAHYSGFVTTNEKLGRALFYWLFEAAEDPASKPLVLWLNGGPGCSSVGFGEAEEIGPFHIKSDGKTLYLNQYSWNQAQDSLTFLLKWVERYPEYKGREFYIVGESYAGHYIPQLSQAIVRHNQASGENTINLKGYMVGNGLMDDLQDRLGLFQYIWTLGFISDQTYALLKLQCGPEPFIHSSDACNDVLETADKEIGNIDHYSVFTPACVASASQARMLLKRRRPVSDHELRPYFDSLGFQVNSRVSEAYDPCTEKHSKVYFNLPDVQKALHVPPQVAPSKWDTCNGDADAVVPVTSTRYSIDALNLSTSSPYGPWYIDGQVGGWTQQYAGLNFVTVRGAGHEVPLHRPKEALAIFKAFISGTPLLSTPENSIRSEMSELVLGLQHVVIKRRQEHKTLKVGSILWITGTLTPYGRVDGYYFGSVTKPDYIARLFPDFQFPLDDPQPHVSFMKEFAEYIDEEDLYKRFHDPLRQEFDFFDEAKEEVIDWDSTTKNISEEENSNKMVPGMTLIDQHFRRSPNLGAQGSTGQNYFHQPETYPQNQFGIGPHLVPSLAPVMPMMNNQLLDSRSRQNLGAQGSTMFAGDQNKFNQQQPFGMPHPPSLYEIDPFMSNQPNQMGIISNLALRMITADLMMNLQQYLHGQISNILQGGRSGTYGVDLSYSNKQHFGLPLTQQMESQVFHPGPSSYRGRGAQRTRARGRGRKRSIKYKPM
ncbi:hypothetical protein Bca101_022592 [Brassica carinata]